MDKGLWTQEHFINKFLMNTIPDEAKQVRVNSSLTPSSQFLSILYVEACVFRVIHNRSGVSGFRVMISPTTGRASGWIRQSRRSSRCPHLRVRIIGISVKS